MLPETTMGLAEGDAEVSDLLARAGALLDVSRWSAAAEACEHALARYPYYAKCWQLLARAREGELAFSAAEIAWRTAAAYGTNSDAAAAGLATSLAKQLVDPDRFPLRTYRRGPAAQQVPGLPDIVLLAQLVWHTDSPSEDDCLRLLRTCATLDATLAAMIAQPRFARANINWLGVMRSRSASR